MTPLFRIRASAASLIMTDPVGKTPMEKYLEAVSTLKEKKEKWGLVPVEKRSQVRNSELKASIDKLESEIPALEKSKETVVLGETAKSYALQWQRGQRWNRTADFSNKYTQKGSACEEDGFDLVATLKGIMLYKNPIKLENEWATGTPDPFNKLTGKLINKDIKSSWDWTTFPYKSDKLDKVYEWQNMIYAWLGEEESWTTTYCLVNTPPNLLRREKERKWYDLGGPDRNSDSYVEACIEIEKRGIYDMELFLKRAADDGEPFELHCKDWKYDVPANERIMEFTTMLEMEKIEALKERVIQVRKFLETQ